MPTHRRDDGKPVVEFDPRLEMSPFTLFRRLRDGRPVELVDVRPPEGRATEATLRGAAPYLGSDWEPPGDRDIVLFDDDGTLALELARGLQEAGFGRVRALFGGLDLYSFSLDPEVVGADTYLEKAD